MAHPRFWPTWAMVGLWRGSAALPPSLMRAAGSGLGAALYLAAPAKRRIARINVDACFPDWDAGRRRALVRAHFRALGQGILNSGMAFFSSGDRLARQVRVEGGEHLDQAARDGRAVILLAPHNVDLQLGAIRLSKERPLLAMYKKPANRLLHEGYLRVTHGRTTSSDWLDRLMPMRAGAHPVWMAEYRDGLKPVVRALRGAMPLYYSPDQDLGDRHSVFADFFGVPASTVSALGRLAALADAIVLPCFTYRCPSRGGLWVTVKPPLAGFPEGDPVRDAARVNAEVEAMVSAAPASYLWVHRRFKTRPPGEPALYPKRRRRGRRRRAKARALS